MNTSFLRPCYVTNELCFPPCRLGQCVVDPPPPHTHTGCRFWSGTSRKHKTQNLDVDPTTQVLDWAVLGCERHVCEIQGQTSADTHMPTVHAPPRSVRVLPSLSPSLPPSLDACLAPSVTRRERALLFDSNRHQRRASHAGDGVATPDPWAVCFLILRCIYPCNCRYRS